MSSSISVDEDVFSRILSHIADSRTVHVVLRALPKSHPLFFAAFHRLCELPIHLDTFDSRAAAASNEVLDYLLAPDANVELGIAESIRHLVVAVEHEKYRSIPQLPEDEVEAEGEGEEAEGEEGEEAGGEGEEEAEEEQVDEDSEEDSTERKVISPPESDSESDEDVDVAAFHDRLPGLFKRTRNLRTLDYQSCAGLPLSRENVELLATCERLHTFAADTAESWDIQPFLSTLAPNITSLNLRHISQTLLTTLVSHGDVFATYTNLEHLKLDITEDVWNWPQNDYVFPSLRLPALRRLELVVADLTLSRPRAGPLDLVDYSQLTELSLDIRAMHNGYDDNTIRLFEALGAADFPVLSHLEIKDGNNTANGHRLKWEPDTYYRRTGRLYPGLVERFLGPLSTLFSLWVDERVLLLGTFCGVRDFWDKNYPDNRFFEGKASYQRALEAALPRLESLRMGFGGLEADEIGMVLDQCDPTKLREFGFRFRWKNHKREDHGRDDPIPPELLAHLARFPKLTDVHILFPRPETQFTGVPDPVVDPRTIKDVASIFKCNGSICRVGIGNSIVWERGVGGDGEILLVSDGSRVPNDAVPRFYHAGYMVKYNPKSKHPWVHFDNTTPLRPNRGEEIQQLREVLKRILE
ncbi:hypothetical protein C8F04DRAFT_1069458 [Mycena alexandri]|uniref:Uncharacterized protein n=1 Tax=Mycena alexandri TaxID=1745969 RepID=A0AAD6TJ22_9AGAR|nr:hypothetical protein C8F04DRAFT_1069458 [Mycena alexandri]